VKWKCSPYKTGLERKAENIPELEERGALSPTKWAKY